MTTFEELRYLCDRAAEYLEDWQGIPVPIEEFPLRLHDRHPLRDKMRHFYEPAPEPVDPTEEDRCVNSWVSRQRQARVYVCRRRSTGKAYALVERLPPDGAMDRLTLWLTTLGASDAWDVKAEAKARDKLRGLLSDRQWRHYELTGTFLESSPRSRLTYLFRRSRPTIALSERWEDRPDRKPPESMRCLAVLCMHSVGYYDRTWAGCLTPTDDLIAHLIMLRADEVGFWKQANQHDPASPEAGL